MRHVAKTDRNQHELVDKLRDLGATVESLHRVGGGCPDLLVGWRGRNLLLEVKDGSLVPSKCRLNELQTEWHRAWRGQVAVAKSFADVIDILGLRRRE